MAHTLALQSVKKRSSFHPSPLHLGRWAGWDPPAGRPRTPGETFFYDSQLQIPPLVVEMLQCILPQKRKWTTSKMFRKIIISRKEFRWIIGWFQISLVKVWLGLLLVSLLLHPLVINFPNKTKSSSSGSYLLQIAAKEGNLQKRIMEVSTKVLTWALLRVS